MSIKCIKMKNDEKSLHNIQKKRILIRMQSI